MENPILKFHRLTDEQVLEQLNEKAVDAQWDVNNAKSPKGKRDAQEALDLFGSAVEAFKTIRNVTVNISRIVDQIHINNDGSIKGQDVLAQTLRKIVDDANSSF